MSFNFYTNQIPTTGCNAMYQIMQNLITAGWSVVSSSDGTTYNATGNQITNGGTGAGGLFNSLAWFRIQSPAGLQKRELIFQISNSGNSYLWRIKYSGIAGFIGGSPAPHVVPSASDEVIVIGGGTDAAPTFYSLFANDGTYILSMAIGDSSVGYGFYWFAWTIGAGAASNICSSFIMDVLEPGTYDASDMDPCVIYSNGIATSAFTGISTYSSARGLLANTTMSLVSLSVVLAASTGNGIFPSAIYAKTSQNSINNKDELIPAFWGRDPASTAPIGMKGQSAFILLSSANHSTLSLQSLNGVGDRIILGYYSFPWDGSLPRQQ